MLNYGLAGRSQNVLFNLYLIDTNTLAFAADLRLVVFRFSIFWYFRTSSSILYDEVRKHLNLENLNTTNLRSAANARDLPDLHTVADAERPSSSKR